jgi:sugar lactone lactonase YvrE
MRPQYLFIAGFLTLLLPQSSRAEKLVLVAGGSDASEPVAATQAKLVAPFAVDFDREGRLLFVEMKGHRVRAIDSAGMLSTIAGTGKEGSAGDGGSPRQAEFNGMHHLVVSKSGDIYIGDTWNNCVRKIDPDGMAITRFAGTGRKAFGGDGGPAASAEFGGVYCLAFNPSGEKMFIADLDNRRIRSIDMATGDVQTVAGNGQKGIPKDGEPAVNSPLVDPRAVAADARGNVYILERSGNALRVVDSAGKIRTLVGPGVTDCLDETGKAPLPMKGPKHLCIDLDGNVLIADTENHLIRRYLPKEKKLVNVVGTGKAGSAGLGGPPLEAQLNQPHGVFVHPSGTLYIADSTNNRLVRVEP